MLKKNWWRSGLIPGQSMTFIIGMRCKEGIVIASDSMVLRGTETTEEEKIFSLPNGIVIGASGTTGFFDKFLLEINQKITEQSIRTFQDLLYAVDGCLSKLCQIYGTTDLEVLMAVPGTVGETSLYHAINTGYSEKVKSYFAIGHGATYGAFLIKKLFKKDMKMVDGAELGILIVEFFNKFKIDNSVGGEPQVWYIPDKPNDFTVLKEDEQQKFLSRKISNGELTELKKKAKIKMDTFDGKFDELFKK